MRQIDQIILTDAKHIITQVMTTSYSILSKIQAMSRKNGTKLLKLKKKFI